MVHLQKFIRNFVPCTLLIHVPFYWNVILSVHSGESNPGKSICANQTHKRLIYKLVKLLFNLPWERYLIQEPKKFIWCFWVPTTLSEGTTMNTKVKALSPHSQWVYTLVSGLGQHYIKYKLDYNKCMSDMY